MRYYKLSRSFRTVFILLAVIGISVNFTADILSYKRNRTSDKQGQNVIYSYEVRIHLNQLIQLLSEAHPSNLLNRQKIKVELDFLRQNIKDPRQLKLFEELESIVSTDSPEVLKIARLILQTEEKLLLQTVQDNLKQDEFIENSMAQGLYLDGFLIGILLIIYIADLHLRKKTEDNLKDSINMMRETLLNLEQEKLKQQINLKTTVHDLKNPIGSIYGFAEVLQEKTESKESVLEFSEIIKRISKKSLDLVENILHDESPKKEKFEKIDLIPILHDVCFQMEIQAEQKRQKIVKNFKVSAAMIQGDRIRIEEVISNLISNSIKYSPFSSEITVHCFENEGRCRIEVEDEGPGFSVDDKLHAFQYGKKLSAQPTNHESSTGLGLFVVKKIIENHRGTVEIVDNTLVSGGRVAFEVPLFPAKSEGSAKLKLDSRDGRSQSADI